MTSSMQGSVLLINIPSKVWQPKQVNKFIPTDNYDDIGDGVFDYKQYGNAAFRPLEKWTDAKRDDIIQYNDKVDKKEFLKHIRIGDCASRERKSTITGIVKKYWDCFCKRGARRPILNYEFAIDTCSSKPVCCRKPRYGPYKSKIIMQHV